MTTDASRKIAESLVPCRCSYTPPPHKHAIDCPRFHVVVEDVADALDAAERRGRGVAKMQGVEVKKEYCDAMMECGILDCTTGGPVFRRVLLPSRGPSLHLTHDGALVPDPSTFVWAFERMGDGSFTGKVIAMKYGTWFNIRWDDCLPPHWIDRSPDGAWNCYSTREQAEAARKDTP